MRIRKLTVPGQPQHLEQKRLGTTTPTKGQIELSKIDKAGGANNVKRRLSIIRIYLMICAAWLTTYSTVQYRKEPQPSVHYAWI